MTALMQFLYTMNYTHEIVIIINKDVSNILCKMFKITVSFIITLFSRLFVRVGILLTRGKHLQDGRFGP